MARCGRESIGELGKAAPLRTFQTPGATVPLDQYWNPIFTP
jgi:hypothetical protein